jgi:hypothetical protein
VNSNKILVLLLLLLFLIVLAPVGKADGINFPVQPLGNVNATVAITPVEDASMPGGDGFGRISLGYALNGLSNEFVYWIANPLVEPFSASGGQITFIPGNYNYPASSESLNISATSRNNLFARDGPCGFYRSFCHTTNLVAYDLGLTDTSLQVRISLLDVMTGCPRHQSSM